jgi:hypothetical protein
MIQVCTSLKGGVPANQGECMGIWWCLIDVFEVFGGLINCLGGYKWFRLEVGGWRLEVGGSQLHTFM